MTTDGSSGTSGPSRTELTDLDQPLPPPTALFAFNRNTRLSFPEGGEGRDPAKNRQTVLLAADQLFHPAVPLDAAVRLGKLRVSEFLPDGREVTRAILQAGTTFYTRAAPGSEDTSEPDAGGDPDHGSPPQHDLANMVLMSLGEMELWLFPAGELAWLQQD
ncbi:MAG: hypothetical protein ABIF77_14000 [bacterium]